MKKKFLAIVLSLSMVLAITACGKNGGAVGMNDSSLSTESTGSSVDTSSSDGGETGSDPSTWPVIKAEVIKPSGESKEVEVEKALNDYLVSIDAGVQCDMVLIDGGERSNQLTLMLTDSGDNGIDLFGWRFYSDVASLVNNDQIISLEKYKEVYPDLWEMFPEAVYKACMIGGELYSMPAADSFGGITVYNLRKDIADEIGYTELRNTRLTEEQFRDMLRKAEAIHPELDYIPDPFVPSYMGIDNFGLNESLGVLMNNGIGADTVVNYYASEEFREYCMKCKEWEAEGIFVSDPLNNTTGSIDNNETGGSMFGAYSCEHAQSIQNAQIRNYEVVVFELGDWVGTNSSVVNGWNISSVCKNPDAAMKLLYLMMTDENVLRFFSLGIEGVTYQVKENGTATLAEGVTGDTVGWYMYAPWWYPNPCLSIPFDTDYAEYYENMMACWSYPADHFSNAMGFVFDRKPVFDQYAACSATVEQYRKALLYGQVDVDSTLEKFNQELEQNGVNEIIEEMQKQYSAFLSENAK
jgi:ABC-type glycerol-3-phosphate transport system substrate-binding protein